MEQYFLCLEMYKYCQVISRFAFELAFDNRHLLCIFFLFLPADVYAAEYKLQKTTINSKSPLVNDERGIDRRERIIAASSF